MNDNKFCPLPWLHSFVNNDGTIQVCCTGEEYDNAILDNSGNAFQIRDYPDVEQVHNSEFMKNLRLQMLSGKLPEICTRCIEQEQSGSISRREVELQKYSQLSKTLIEQTSPTGEIKVNIKSLDYRLGNLCNLQCRMCHPKASTNWIDDYLVLKKGLIDDNDVTIVGQEYQLTTPAGRDILLEDFEKKIHACEDLHFGGGEPLISPTMLKILNRCVEEKIAHKIKLTYNTNLTMLPEKVLELWKHFRAIELYVSIDAVGDLNNYIRYPSKWEDIDKNMHFIDNNFQTYNISKVLVSTTVQLNNIFHLEKIYKYLSQFQNISELPNLVPIMNPVYMRFALLPTNLKNEVNRKLKKISQLILLGNFKDEEKGLKDIRHIVALLKMRYGDQSRLKFRKQFKEFTLRFDKSKGLDFRENNPEFQNLFDSLS